MMTKFEKVKRYLLANEEELFEVVREVNCYNGSLDFLDVYENTEENLNGLFSEPAEAIRSIYFGGHYEYSDEFIRMNAYHNLYSLNIYELKKELKYYIDEICGALLQCYEEIEISKELKEILED